MQKIFHLHLPKTGGMALRSFLAAQLGNERVSPPLGGIKLGEALLQWSRLTAISGHFVAARGDVLPRLRFCLTVLRHPLERTISEFNYNKHDVDDLLLGAKRFSLDLDAHLESLAQAPADQTLKQLAMLYPLGTTCQTRLTTDEKLTAAKRALDQFDLIGVKEELQDFTCMLSASMGWPATQLEHVNVSSRRVALDALTAAQVRALNEVLEPEIELYEHALVRFRHDRRRFIGLVDSGEAAGGVLFDAIHGGEPTEVHSAEREIPKVTNFGDKRCEITSVTVAGKITGFQQVMAGELMNITIQFVANQAIDQLNAGIAINDERGVLMFGTNSLLQGDLFELSAGKYAVTFTMLNRLGPGRYKVSAALIRTVSHYDDCYHWWKDASEFSVEAYAAQHYEGRVLMDAEVSFGETSSGATWTRLPIGVPGVDARAFGRLNEPLSDFKASIKPMTQVDELPCGIDALLQMRLQNIGQAAWPSTGRNPVHLSYRWLTQDGHVVVQDGLRTTLSTDVTAGSSLVISLHVRTPKAPGSLVLLVSLVQEQVAWFVDQDPASACYLPVLVIG